MAALFSDRQRLAAARRVFEHLGSRLELPFAVRLWDGSTIPVGSADGPRQTVAIRGPGVLGALLRRPSLDTLFRQFVGGQIEVPDGELLACFLAAQRGKKQSRPSLAALRRDFPWGAILPLVTAFDRPVEVGHAVEGRGAAEQRRKATDQALVRFHYDVGNEFYGLFLDGRMVYSCAYFTTWSSSLDQAQEDKLDLVCRKLRLRPGERFLDIGCGWGALVCHAARHYGVRAHGVTLSQAQHDHARALVERLGLAGRVRIDLADYTSLEDTYDKIASVGMYEHVGIQNYPKYFQTIQRLLVDEGIFLNHGITRRAKGNIRNFGKVSPGKRVILNYIFPGSELDHIGHTLQVMESSGFEIYDVEGLRPHYARTCRLWYERLVERRQAAIDLVGPARYRAWLAYLAGVTAGFEVGPLRIYQTVATKTTARAAAPLPPTRADLYRDWPGPARAEAA